MKNIGFWLKDIYLMLKEMAKGQCLTRVQEGPEPGLLDLKIDKWAAWLEFGILMEILSLFGLVMAFAHPPIEVMDFVPVVILLAGGLLCFHRARMYYQRKIARIHQQHVGSS